MVQFYKKGKILYNTQAQQMSCDFPKLSYDAILQSYNIKFDI
jgi:hypothetical protein